MLTFLVSFTRIANLSLLVNSQALLLSCEFLRLFTTEAVHRSAEELAKQHDDQSLPDRIGVEHLERSVVQLLLDF
ncbi:hypothetical protein VTP01DRAFT_9064 [Rhizomucor pusillus]|uniref:uncharacterized protein n=1 Tax=Rhizomucor pusillus TaxID=4840 RepID=UPI0037442170